MPPISIMLKPFSSGCNLACEYCFYHTLADSRAEGFRGVMSTRTYDDIIKKALAFADGQRVMVSFQGGEPLLAGKEFFRHALDVTEKLNIKKSPVYIGVQTNGTLLDEEWCEIFKGRALVGLSLDGDAYCDGYRLTPDGHESFTRALDGAKLLQSHGVEFNILTVITKRNAAEIEEAYEFFKSQGFRHLQYIPCLRPMEGGGEEYCLSGEEYGEFLIKAFGLYARDLFADDYVSVRIFDNFVNLANFLPAEQCGMNGHCTHQYVIESDGETYPCDFYCLDDYSLGNIKDTDFARLEHHPTAVKFLTESLKVADGCKHCNFYALCRGGCKRERISLDLCTAYKKFLPYAAPILRKIKIK